MSYGMKLFNSVGEVTYDTSSQGGVFIEFLTIPVRTTDSVFTVEYPSLTGRNIYVVPVVTGDASYKLYGPQDRPVGYGGPLGYPVLQYRHVTAVGAYGFSFVTKTVLMVFAL